MSTYSLGSSTFCLLRRDDQHGHAPELLSEMKSVLARPGVNGVSVRSEGLKGLPFQMVSLRDVEQEEYAHSELTNYKAMESEGIKQTLVWDGVDYSAQHGLKYIVLRVHSPIIQAISNAAGPMKQTTTPRFILMCVWDLIPVTATDS